MADDQSGKAPDSLKSTSEADSQKEKKKLEAKKSPSKKSPKTKKAKKKAAKKRSKSHEKRKEKKREGKKHRRSQEEPAPTHGRAPPADGDETGGESLAPCSEQEWEEEGQAAYSAALLNVKRKPVSIYI